MSRPLQLTQWQDTLSSQFPNLRLSVVRVLALYSFGVILAGTCGLTSVSVYLALLLFSSVNTIRKRLSEFYKGKQDKSGVKRRDFAVNDCFVPLLRWILTLWPSTCLPLAIDVTNLGDRFHVLVVSVVVNGTAIPVAWKVLPGGLKEPWNPHWVDLLTCLSAAIPKDWTVLVLSDRGLESAFLFKAIVKLGWHPMMRAKKAGKFRPEGWGQFYHLHQLVDTVGKSFAARGYAYAGQAMPCTLLAMWEEEYAEPWFVLTDLPAESANVLWYGLRTWIEQGFKVIKSGGWDWHYTRMEDAERVERLWLVLAVACLWVTAVGAEVENQQQLAVNLKRLGEEIRQGQENYEQNKRKQEEKRRQAVEKAKQRRQKKAAARQAALDAAKEKAAKAKKAKEKQGTQKAKTGAEAAKTGAEAAKTGAEAAKTGAEAAKTGAEAAKTGAEAAKTGAEAAETGAEAAKATTTEGKATEGKRSKAKAKAPAPRSKKGETAKQRVCRLSKLGRARLITAWMRGENHLPRCLYPKPWQKPLPRPPLSEKEFVSQRKTTPSLLPHQNVPL